MGKGISGLRRALIAGAALALCGTDASAGIALVGQSAEVNRAGDSAHFSLTFNQVPDFSSRVNGVPVNSFQYEVNGNWTGMGGAGPLGTLTSVIRGDEISIADALRVRSADVKRPDPDPASGGWGPVLGTVPFELSGKTVAFDVPLSLLGDDDGVFAYRVFAVDAGTANSIIEAHVVPLPMGALTGGAGIAGLAVVEMVRRRRASHGISL